MAPLNQKNGESADNAAGKAAYAKYAGCHGKDGKTQALGKSAVIAGQDVEILVTSMNEYKAGTRNNLHSRYGYTYERSSRFYE